MNFVTRGATSTLPEAGSLQPAPNPSTPGGEKTAGGGPRVHASPGDDQAEQRASASRASAARRACRVRSAALSHQLVQRRDHVIMAGALDMTAIRIERSVMRTFRGMKTVPPSWTTNSR